MRQPRPVGHGASVKQSTLRMLTIRKVRVASGDGYDAHRRARYWLEAEDSPAAFAEGAEPGPTAVWLGAHSLLERLQVRAGGEVGEDQLALALQGRSARSGEQLRRPGWIQKLVFEEGDDGRGKRREVRVLGTKCVDLTFSAPKSVSVLWSQAEAALRGRIEAGMLAGAGAMLGWMTATKPVVKHQRQLVAATGFAAAAILHVKSRTAQGETAPWPQLHVHGVVVGVERPDGYFASPELSGMFKAGAPLEGGAVARAKLAESLREAGFELDCESGRDGRFFEVRGVPPGLVRKMSGRSRDVEAKVREREAGRRRPLSNEERAVAALQTRAPKRAEESPRRAAAIWRAEAEAAGFGGAAAVSSLQGEPGFAERLPARRQAVRERVQARLAARGGAVSPGELRATVFESAAGRLRLAEATGLLEELLAG